MYRQNVLLRQHALGRFDQLLHAVAKDPAMLIYLDSATNRRGSPNGEFRSRSDGIVHPRRRQIQRGRHQARGARVHRLEHRSGHRRVHLPPHVARRGEKTVFGKTGNFDGDAVLDIILAQPAVSEFIVRKLWREFVSPTPDDARVKWIAAQFRASGWNIAQPVRLLLLQPEVIVRDEDNALVKSPAELVVGLVRQSGGELQQPIAAAVALAGMGQNLFSPPNVRGWPGGEAWINTQTLLARKQFLERSLSGKPSAETAMKDSTAPAMKADAIQIDAMKADDVPRRRLQMLEQTASVRVDPEAWLAQAGLAPERVVAPAARSQARADGARDSGHGADSRRSPGARCAGHSRARPCLSTQMTWSMNRRMFLTASSAMLSYAALPGWAATAVPRLLILIELRGGNDALNTVVPVDDGTYFDLRPRLALKSDTVVRFRGRSCAPSVACST